MATIPTAVPRALLYVPGASRKMLEKSYTLKADCIAFDLEDSVTPSLKQTARALVCEHLSKARVVGPQNHAVRINAVDSGFALQDLTEVLQADNLDAICVPKVQSATDMHFLTDVIRHLRGESSGRKPVRILALIESARGIMNLAEICRASPLLSGLVFASEDFALDLSLTRTPDLKEFLYARSAIVTACQAYELPSRIDLVCTQFRGEQGRASMERESLEGKGLGFNGKQCIHPSQVEIAQSVFSPSEQEVEWAVRVSIASLKADEQGRGAWSLGGKMIDVPVIRKALSIVEKAKLCGMDLSSLQAKWKDQQPE